MSYVLLMISIVAVPTVRPAAVVVEAQEFNSLAACEVAMTAIRNATSSSDLLTPIMRCVPK